MRYCILKLNCYMIFSDMDAFIAASFLAFAPHQDFRQKVSCYASTTENLIRTIDEKRFCGSLAISIQILVAVSSKCV